LIEGLAEQRKKDAGKLILGQLARDQKVHETTRFKITKKSRKVPGFRSDQDTLIKLSEATGRSLEEIVGSVSSISTGKLNSWLKALPKEQQEPIKALLLQQQTLNQTPPWIETKEIEPLF